MVYYTAADVKQEVILQRRSYYSELSMKVNCLEHINRLRKAIDLNTPGTRLR